MKALTKPLGLCLAVVACTSTPKVDPCLRNPASAGTCANAAEGKKDLSGVFAPGKLKELIEERYQLVRRNISPDGNKGAVAVTTTPYNHEYDGWTWIRDAALLMRQVVGTFERSTTSTEKQTHFTDVADYEAFNRKLQESGAIEGLGEPRFNFLGEPYMGGWGRPQNDGPALRTLTLVQMGLSILRAKNADPSHVEWAKGLYKVEPYDKATSTTKRDLEYIVNNFQKKSFCLWEESLGLHFYTLIAQRAALVRGSEFARLQGDPFAADHYLAKAGEISQMLETFWNPEKKQVDCTHEGERERNKKEAALDIAVLLGVIHTGDTVQSFSVLDPRILATVLKIEQTFTPMYEINKITHDAAGNPLGPAIGRYPEDVYNGSPDEAQRFTGGHPWVLATTAVGEVYSQHASAVISRGHIEITDVSRPFYENILGRTLDGNIATIKKSDPLFKELVRALRAKSVSYANRIAFHFGPNATLSEMINKDTGQRQSIPSLGWSDVSYMSMLLSLQNLDQLMSRARINPHN